jgi:hypothetical protein
MKPKRNTPFLLLKEELKIKENNTIFGTKKRKEHFPRLMFF